MIKLLLPVVACITSGLLAISCEGQPGPAPAPGATPPQATQRNELTPGFTITSDAFAPNEPIPARYTCDGENISPALSWSGAPEKTVAYALVLDDPDAPRGVFTHWTIYNLPASVHSLAAGVPSTETLQNGGLQGRNDGNRIGYAGPCPPSGNAHHYGFTLYALDRNLDLQPDAAKQQVLDAIKGHTLAQAQLVGTYKK